MLSLPSFNYIGATVTSELQTTKLQTHRIVSNLLCLSCTFRLSEFGSKTPNWLQPRSAITLFSCDELPIQQHSLWLLGLISLPRTWWYLLIHFLKMPVLIFFWCFLYDARTPTTGSPMFLRYFNLCLSFVFIWNSINVQSLLSVIFNKVKSTGCPLTC